MLSPYCPFCDGDYRLGQCSCNRPTKPFYGGPSPLNTVPCTCGPRESCSNCPPVTSPEPRNALSLPDDDAKRQEYPMADGLLDYFPNALAEVSRVSKIGNDQHNPGQPMHWARDKSTDHANKIMRHLVDRGRFDGRGVRHTARLAWRALAMLQTELEQEEGFPQSRRSEGQAPSQAAA